MKRVSKVPYLTSIRTVTDRMADVDRFPFTLPFVRDLELPFTSPITLFVGENGSGKSTLIEAIAALCGLPIAGGGPEDLADNTIPAQQNELAHVLRPSFRKRPPRGYFFRAELQAQFASLLDTRSADPDFLDDPYRRYGGRSLHSRSHGEAFLAIIEGSFTHGLFLLDEPESALSPQRQLTLLIQMWQLTQEGTAQFIVATHSPILMTFPDAQIVNFNEVALPNITLEDTAHYQITRGILESPDRYWKHLTKQDSE